MKKNLISILITFVIGGIIYYITLPPFNLHSLGFWVFIISLIFIFSFIYSVLNASNPIKIIKQNHRVAFTYNGSKSILIAFTIALIIIGCIALTNIIFSPIFMAKSYSERIIIDETKSFANDVEPVDFSRVPLIDKDSSTKLGDRVMGGMPELVSQFYVSNLYTQINYNDEILRVTPLEYNGILKYFANKKDGVKGYITVNSVTGESKLVKLKNGMKYMNSAILNEDLTRHLRFSYPTKIFGNMSFEIDNEGNPYWIVPTLKYTAVGLKEEVASVILLDPITGKSTEYKIEDVPTWVDQIYAANLIIEQVDDWGTYKGGFLNSIFGEKNVVVTTDGYNYMTMGDDVYLYTGITSTSSDESNIGFILTNLRTKETNFYAVPGAEEYSAMDSAKGQVQQMNYESSFPLLINLNNRPTYLLSLKDAAGLVKMYAFVDVEDYQKVVITDASKGIETAKDNYLNNANLNNKSSSIEKFITINSIKEAIIDGTTYYYINDIDNKKYKVSIKTNTNLLPFINTGDTLKIKYNNEKDVTDIIEINKN